MLLACKQHKALKPLGETVAPADSAYKKQFLVDTNIIAIFPTDKCHRCLPGNVTSFNLTNNDLQTTEDILLRCITNHNNKQDSTKEFSEYIDLKKYKRQYIPFVNAKGERKVYVNCFCNAGWNFNDWKNTVVLVDDGGSCFFRVVINLTTLEFEDFGTNGYG